MTTILLLGGERYSKTDAARHCQELLRHAPLFTAIVGHNAAFLDDLLGNHPDAKAKVGVGITHHTVQPTIYGARGFFAHRLDGSSTDWSYKKALAARTNAQDVRAAMRHEIQPQIFAFRDQAFANVEQIQCPVSGLWVTKLECHIDHARPITFIHLTDNWTAGQGGYQNIRHGSNDGQIGRRMTDPEQRASWCAYHLERAQLRVVDPGTNVGLLNRAHVI